MVFLKRGTSFSVHKKLPPPTPPPQPPLPAAEEDHEALLEVSRGGEGNKQLQNGDMFGTVISVLADAGCTLCTTGSPSLPSDLHNFRRHLESRFSADASLVSRFLSGLSYYIRASNNFRRILIPVSRGDGGRGESLVRLLLLVPSLQLQLQLLLLEKLPEHFDDDCVSSSSCSSLHEDFARLIVNQFLWLDFLVNPDHFSEKLLELLGICPLPLKKEIIGALPEMIGDGNNPQVVTVLKQMLKDDLEVIVPVLDSLSNLNLDENLQDEVTTIALSCIRTVKEDYMPHLLRYLLLSATPESIKRIITQIRQQVQFICVPDPSTANKKLKGKCAVRNSEASILEALETSVHFKNMICEEILKELKSLKAPHDHKVIDIWFLVLIYKNGGFMQKIVEKIIKKKIVEGFFWRSLFDQCIHGHGELVKVYFTTFLSIIEYLLACKEIQAREFAVHIYISLFEELDDTYSRQEILGTLVTHIGTGVDYEVGSALDIMIFLTSKYSKDLIPISSHINGILDYLERFHVENLHKVYEVFCQLALFTPNANCNGLSNANELFMIVRKQVGNPDMRYKKMGIVGTLKIISKLGDINATVKLLPSKKLNDYEALELLTTSLNSCKSSTLSLILLYDELIAILESTTLPPAILEWLGRHVGEFESNFLSDLDAGRLPSKNLPSSLEGELWMSLDGDISPVCLDILQMLSFSQNQCSEALQLLPVQFLLLSTMERSANQGSLGGIDALLGCPIHLPSPRYFSESLWSSLTGTQKTMLSLSLFYAVNWIRELINAFSTQVASKIDCISQATKEEVVSKLLKRLRNLIFVEGLLNWALRQHPITLPELHNYAESCGSPYLCNSHNVRKKHGFEVPPKENLSRKKKLKKKMKPSKNLDANEKLRQPTILEMLKTGGAIVSQEMPTEGPGSVLYGRMSQTVGHGLFKGIVDVSTVPLFLEEQKFKFRPLQVDCLFLLCFSQGQDSCCSDSAAELPMHLYLLRDLHYKLENLSTSSRQLVVSHSIKSSTNQMRLTIFQFLEMIGPLFPSIRKHFDVAVCVCQEGDDYCHDHWKLQSDSAGNPEISFFHFSKVSTAEFVCKEVLFCFGKLLKCPELYLHMDMLLLRNLLQAFQPAGKMADACLDIQLPTALGCLDYLYRGTYNYLENIMSIACSLSFSFASEVLFTLESLVKSISHVLDNFSNKNAKNTCLESSHDIYSYFQKRLGTSACNLLFHNWDNDKKRCKGDIIQKIVSIYLNNNESTSDVLVDFACSVLPQVSNYGMKNAEGVADGIPTLCSVSFVHWYRVLHEENISALNKLILESMTISREVQYQIAGEVLIKLRQFVDVAVSLVSLCRTHDKVTVHAMAIKYGGKFVDIFLKAFDFLEAHFQAHDDTIIRMVKELQKATRIMQSLCSEAKVSKRTMVTNKIPAIKRSLERLLFCVKALLHNKPSECTFWMGSLKHKDLLGQVVSSQAYGEVDDSVVEHNPEMSNQMEPYC